MRSYKWNNETELINYMFYFNSKYHLLFVCQCDENINFIVSQGLSVMFGIQIHEKLDSGGIEPLIAFNAFN